MNTIYNPPDSEEFRTLCSTGRGVLLQTNHLQIGTIVEATHLRVSLTFYYGNMTGSPLENIETSVDNPDRNSLRIEVDDASPSNLQPQQQVAHVVRFYCDREYVGVPLLRLKYVFEGQEVPCIAPLPLHCAMFSLPLELGSNEFLLGWTEINGNPQEQQLSWQTRALNPQRVSEVLRKLNFQIVAGVDEPDNVLGSCQFYSSSMRVPALCRIEADSVVQMLRVTVKSFSPTLSFGLAQLIQNQVA